MEPHLPRIAVLYATSAGSTREVAEFIGAELTGRGAHAEVSDVEHAPDLALVDAVVLGSAVHDRALLAAVTEYAHNHRRQLSDHDVWLFSVGLGPALRGPLGRWAGRLVPPKIAAVRDEIGAREYRAFAGRFDGTGMGPAARILYRLMGGPPYGDLRDWDAIRAWAGQIAAQPRPAQPDSATARP